MCNPPYIGYADIGDRRKHEAATALLRAPWNPSFLKQNGRLVFITSGEWLDSHYGAQLQNWLLLNTHIELVVESLAETWFSEARVGTVVLCARRINASNPPPNRTTRFLTLRKPLRTLYGCVAGETPQDHIAHVDAFRDTLLGVSGLAFEGIDYDYSVVGQDELTVLGQRP